MQVDITQFVEGPYRTKRWRKGDSLSLLELRCPSSPASEHQCSWFSYLDPDQDLHHQSPNSLTFVPKLNDPLAPLILQFADGRSWDLSTSVTAGVKSYNESPLIYISTYPVDPVCLQNTNTISIEKKKWENCQYWWMYCNRKKRCSHPSSDVCFLWVS